MRGKPLVIRNCENSNVQLVYEESQGSQRKTRHALNRQARVRRGGGVSTSTMGMVAS